MAMVDVFAIFRKYARDNAVCLLSDVVDVVIVDADLSIIYDMEQVSTSLSGLLRL